MNPLKSMNPCELVVLGVLIALSICDDLSATELNVLGNLISAIGSIISTWASQKEFLEESCESRISLEDIEKRVQNLENERDTRSGGTGFPYLQ